MNVYWLEQTQANPPAEDDWLSPAEVDRLSRFRISKRRADWLLGRWTAKHAVAACLNHPTGARNFSDLEIRAATSGEPEAYLDGEPLPVSISISHRADVGLCIVGPAGAKLGCDLELVEEHSRAFAEDYFTAEELALISQNSPSRRALLLSLLWSAKESALKAVHEGLRLNPRSISIGLDLSTGGSNAMAWSPLQVGAGNGSKFSGWWRQSGDLLRTIVAVAPSLHVFPITLGSHVVSCGAEIPA